MPDDPLARAHELDRDDPIAGFRDRFMHADEETVYFDGNSLGRLPHATRDRLRTAVDEEWGAGLVRGWSRWIELARQAGDVLATGVLGVDPGEVVLADSTSVNLYKLAAAALDARPGRRAIVVESDNFPTDLYVLQGLAAARGLDLRVVPVGIDDGLTVADLDGVLDDDVALLCASHIAYRSGARTDLRAITARAHDAGALTLWDLSHAAGSVPTPLREAGADLAVGCTYKYLNGGPGAPAFLYVRAGLQAELRQPIWGWFGQRDQFAMGSSYEPVDGIERFVVGTPPVLGGYAALEGARITAEAGMAAIAAKGAALTGFALDLTDAWLAGHGFAVATPRDPARRGAHVTLHHPRAWQVTQALLAAAVVPDFRTPDRLRIGLAPLYTRFVDVYEGFARLRRIMETRAYSSFPAERSRVT
ncbi:kynureninase [Virgisporangium aurantiacum]|uniref:Kynureninase n=1 Tax=Virgisporangium aurantiacum TaxID=175570 RepID=A0A8J3Z7X2_9ACTN|nr:kynureninase [Virgisporangium aurantiacum]GIJ57993.1 kynureninase [Virgisporangium aurantiacum]